MGCQSGQLMLNPRRRRPDLVKDFLAGPVFKFTYLFYLPQSCKDLDLLMDLKNLDAECGQLIADAEEVNGF